MARYSKELQQTVIQRMAPPRSQSVSELSEEFGIPEATLYTWRSKALARGELVGGQRTSGATASGWTAETKLDVPWLSAAYLKFEKGEALALKKLAVMASMQ